MWWIRHTRYTCRELGIFLLSKRYFIGIIILILLASLYTPLHLESDIFKIRLKTNLQDQNDINELNDYLNLQDKYVWNLDVNAIRSNILTWFKVKNVNVKIILPNILYIKIFKRTPYAVWWNYKDFLLVDSEGVILSKNVSEANKRKYILIVGHDAMNNLGPMIEVIRASTQNGKIASMRFIGCRRWDIILKNGMILKLPENKAAEAISLFENITNSRPDLVNDASVIDMRLAPDKIFIQHAKD